MPQKYKIGLRLLRNAYVDLSTPNNLFNSKRGFVIFQWDDTHEVTKHGTKVEKDASGKLVKTYHIEKIQCGGWKPWLAYRASKWYNVSKVKKYDAKAYKDVMIPMHMYWETRSDFVDWIGKDVFKQLVADLI